MYLYDDFLLILCRLDRCMGSEGGRGEHYGRKIDRIGSSTMICCQGGGGEGENRTQTTQ